MYDSVRAAILPWLAQFEGLYLSDGSVFAWLGLDKLGRPAGPIGSDFSSPRTMALVTWRHEYDRDEGGVGTIASYDEICHEWARVQAMQSSKLFGGASSAFRDSAHLYVDLPSLYAYLTGLLASQERLLRSAAHVGAVWDVLPAVCQLARLRTAYAEGGGAAWPHLDAALARGDWQTAADESSPSDLQRQPIPYRQSYLAVRELYLLAPVYPGSALPDPLPSGR